jgi:hypothetical protein
MNKKIVILLIVLVALTAAGWYFYPSIKNLFKGTEIPNENQNGNEQVIEPEYSAEELLSMPWKTYTNEELGFSIEYPEVLEVKEVLLDNVDKTFTFSSKDKSSGFGILIYTDSSEKALKENIENFTNGTIKKEDITIGGLPATKVIYQHNDGEKSYLHFLLKDNIMYRINFSPKLLQISENEYAKVIERVVNSISFD